MRRHVRPLRSLRPNAATTDERPPDLRLAAALGEPNPERSRRIFSRIRSSLDVEPPVRWLDAARTLHERGTIGRDIYWHLLTLFVEVVIQQSHDTDPELVRIREEMDAIERAHGLDEDESFFTDDAPPEWVQLDTEWSARARVLELEYLRAHGFDDVAEVMERDRDTFDARAEAGRRAAWRDAEPLGL